MRRSVFQTTRSLTRSVRTETSSVRNPPLPYICAQCRRNANQSSRANIVKPEARRAFVTNSSRHQEASTSPSATLPQRVTITPQTHYDFFPKTFPNGPPPQASFTPDLRQLRNEFLQLQAKAHPDLAPPDRKRQAEALSSRINEAYVTIQDPLKRAQYLLSLQQIDVEDDSAKLSENALLMEVMEAREAVEEVECEEDLVALREENNGRIEMSVNALENAFAKEDMETATTEAIRLRYWKNIEESIRGWEKGKGGGLLHH